MRRDSPGKTVEDDGPLKGPFMHQVCQRRRCSRMDVRKEASSVSQQANLVPLLTLTLGGSHR